MRWLLTTFLIGLFSASALADPPLLQQNQTAHPLVFWMVESADHITPLTGASPTVTISKDGASPVTPSGAVSEVGHGEYIVAGNATDENTQGDLALFATATSGDPSSRDFTIVAYNPYNASNLGLTALPTVAAGSGGGLVIFTNLPTNFGSLSINGSGDVVFSNTTIATATSVSQFAGHAITLDANYLPETDPYWINGIQANNVTTINANIGETQPINFTGTGGSALVKNDTRDWLGTVVGTPATAGIPDINVKNIDNTAALVPGASGGLVVNGSNSGAITFGGGMTISSSGTDALDILANGSGYNAVKLEADQSAGAGVGLVILGGNAGDAEDLTGGSSGGLGESITSQTTHAFTLNAGGSGTAFFATGGSGNGLAAQFVSTGNNPTVILQSQGNADVLYLQEQGSGSVYPLHIAGGGTDAVHIVGGTNGIFSQGSGSGHYGIDAVGTSSAGGINATSIIGSITGSLSGSVASVTGNVAGNVSGSVANLLAINGVSTGSVSAIEPVLGSAYEVATNSSGYVTYANTAPPTAAQNATALLTDTTGSDYQTSGSFGYSMNGSPGIFTTSALQHAPSGGSTPAQIATYLYQDTTATDFETPGSPGYVFDASPGVFTTASLANAPTGGAGSGANTVTVNVKDSSTSANLAGVAVRMFSGGSYYIVNTNGSGNATFYLNNGSWTPVAAVAGYVGQQYAAQAISGNTTINETLVALPQPPGATAPNTTNAYTYTYDQQGNLLAGVTIWFGLNPPKSGGAGGYSPATTYISATSSSGGLLTIQLVQNSSYTAYRGAQNNQNSPRVTFTTGTASTYQLPYIAGTP